MNTNCNPSPLRRLERAIAVRDQVLAADAAHGRWVVLNLGDGRTARLREVDAGAGWSATITTRFSGVAQPVSEFRDYESAALFQVSALRDADLEVDVWVAGVGKVLSVARIGDEEKVVGMIPGPWEAWFGLPPRSYSRAVLARLVRKSTDRATAVQ